MGEHTTIEWTNMSFNPWIGCVKVSDACKNCYAEVSTPARTSRAKGLELWGPPPTARQKTSVSNWKLPLRWNRAAEASGQRARVFCASLADVFEEHPSLPPWRKELWALIEATPWLDWQLLTKRPENIARMIPAEWLKSPRANVWFGATVENQEQAELRIPALLKIPAVARFLSMEPLLEMVDLEKPRCDVHPHADVDIDTYNRMPFCTECSAEASYGHWLDGCASPTQPGINLVIVGGESGHKARPFNIGWAREILRACRVAGVACFIKQFGAKPIARPALTLKDAHGGDWDEWPADLRVREMPVVAR